MNTKEQERSAFALSKVKDVLEIPVDEKVANFIVGVPTLVLTNGFAQTMAFLMSKHKEAPPHEETEEKKKDRLKYKNSFDIIKDWLRQEMSEVFGDADTAYKFLDKLSSIDQKQYLQAQQEALALLQWVKRYARAFQPDMGPQL